MLKSSSATPMVTSWLSESEGVEEEGTGMGMGGREGDIVEKSEIC